MADHFNNRIRETVTEMLTEALATGDLPEDSNCAGPTIIAAVAALMHAAGYLTASFHPHIDGEELSKVARGQFDDGRADFALYHRTTRQ